MIQQEKVPMIKYAMHYGAILGLFWAFKYLFLIGAGFSDIMFIYIHAILGVVTFFLTYVFFFKYRDSEEGKPKNLLKCILFTATMGFFASIFEGAMMYLHYEIIDPLYFNSKKVEPFMHMINSIPNTMNAPNFEESKEILKSIFSNKAIYIFSDFIGNIFSMAFLGLIIGLFADKLKVQ